MMANGLYLFLLFQRESFALYALYSKNKPQSDSLLINHGQAFFKVRTTASLPELLMCFKNTLGGEKMLFF